MIDNEIENMIQDVKTRLSYQGLSIEQYLKNDKQDRSRYEK